ncbi:hypothetical protein J6P68_05505 [bacterium]|nr:hypothetical protein [bacterium]
MQQNTNINGALEVWIQSYCSPGATNKAFPPYGNSNMICSEGNISN